MANIPNKLLIVYARANGYDGPASEAVDYVIEMMQQVAKNHLIDQAGQIAREQAAASFDSSLIS